MTNPYGDIIAELRYALVIHFEPSMRNRIGQELADMETELIRLRKIEAAAIDLEINIKDDTWDSVCEKRKKLRQALERK